MMPPIYPKSYLIDSRQFWEIIFSGFWTCHALTFALKQRRHAREQGDVEHEVLAWRLAGLLPVVLFHKTHGKNGVPMPTLHKRFEDFTQGRWTVLLQDALSSAVTGKRASAADVSSAEHDNKRRAAAAERSVRLGEVSRARQCLTGAALAPGTDETFRGLQERRPKESGELGDDVRSFVPEAPLALDRDLFTDALRSSSKGSSPGPGGCTYELLRVLLDASDAHDEVFYAAQDLARAAVPCEVAEAYTQARLTALRKQDSGVRGIATGTTLRRLVAKTLARQFGGEVEAACAPRQFALSTRAGTDCVGHAVRALTDARPTATLVSVDGVGAFDNVSRKAMLSKLLSFPGARAMLPFVLLSYGQESSCDWKDAEGEVARWSKGKVVNKATHSCRFSSAWGCMSRFRKLAQGSTMANSSSHTWTTSILSSSQNACALCVTTWPKLCSDAQGYA